MAEHHDKSKHPKDGKDKDFPNLEIPHNPPPDEIEVIDDVIEVVEEAAPPSTQAKDTSTVHEELEVIEEVVDEPQIVEEAPSQPPAAKKTPLRPPPDHTGRDPMQTMLASEMRKELEATAEAGPEDFEASDHVDVAHDEEVLDAVEASDLRIEPTPETPEKKVGLDTHADVDLGDAGPQEPLEVVEAPPSSATIAAALAESDDDAPPPPKSEQEEFEAMDKTTALPGTPEAPKPPPVEETQTDVVVEYEDVLVEGESEVDLGGGRKAGPKSDRPSGVDIIAEALESGVDLDRAQSPPPAGKTLPDDSDIAYESILDEGARRADLDSSTVDLGSGQSAALRDEPEMPPVQDEELGGRGAAAELEEQAAADMLEESVFSGSTSSDIHQEDEEVLVTPKKKTMVAPTETVVDKPAEEESVGLIDEAQLEPLAPAGKKVAAAAALKEVDKGESEGEGRGTATMTRRRKQKSSVLPFMVGGVAAALLLLIAVGALWFLAPQLLTDIAQQSPNAPKQIKTTITGTGTGTGAGAPILIAKALEARKLVDDGKFDDAIAMTKDDAEKKEPEALIVHGLATFRKLEAGAKAPLSEQNEAVKKALEEIEQGGAKAVAAEIRSKLALAANAGNDKTAILEKSLADAQEQVKKAVAAEKKATDAKTEAQKKLDAANVSMTKTTEELTEKKKELAKVDVDLKKATDTIKTIDVAIAKAGAKDGSVKGIEELVALREAAIKEREAAAKDRDSLNVAIDAALKELKDANLLTNDTDKAKQLVESTKKARTVGQSPIGSSLGAMVSGLGGLTKEPLGFFRKALENAKTTADLKAAQLQLALTETPDERLDMILAVVKERGTTDAKVLAGFKNYIDWARSKEAKTSPQARVKALYALALIERNRDDFAAARKSLAETVKEAKGVKAGSALETAAAKALAEISDPSVFYLPRALAKIADGHLQPALDDLNSGLKVLPDSPQLLLKRAEVTLLLAKAKGKIDEHTQKLIRADAQGARKDAKLAAESYYIVGQLDEHNGEYGAAETSYREALKLAPNGAEGDRYRIALARVLLRDRTGAPVPEEEPASDEDATTPPLVDVQETMFCSAPWQQDEDAQAKRLEESIKLANELIQSPDPKTRGEGYILLGSAQARQGKKTEGLKNFVKGLELVNPGIATKDLAKIIETHPAFGQPDVAVQANPMQAERSFSKGLEFFWAKKYPQAEDEFKKAVSAYDQDARYRYFLGLSRYLQNTNEKKAQAEFDFEQGVRLEAARKPGAREINSSLERIQGEVRRVLSGYREKMAAPG
jgi:hypothetical protein